MSSHTSSKQPGWGGAAVGMWSREPRVAWVCTIYHLESWCKSEEVGVAVPVERIGSLRPRDVEGLAQS